MSNLAPPYDSNPWPISHDFHNFGTMVSIASIAMHTVCFLTFVGKENFGGKFGIWHETPGKVKPYISQCFLKQVLNLFLNKSHSYFLHQYNQAFQIGEVFCIFCNLQYPTCRVFVNTGQFIQYKCNIVVLTPKKSKTNTI